MNRTARWFGMIVVAQAFFLLAWAGYHEWVRQSAPVILLQGHPVDPQDLLRGDYLALGYDINDVPVSAPGTDLLPDGAFGADIWVLLERRDRYYVAVRASRAKLLPAAGQVLVRGTLASGWSGGRSRERVEYGIEKYFVPEGRGAPRFKRMEVEVSVSPAHRLYIRRVLLDGRVFP